MGSRAEDLTPASQEVAKRLSRRTGSFKVVLSAGVIALNALTAEDRETAVAIANGEDLTLDLYRERLTPGAELLDAAEARLRETEPGVHRRSKSTPQKRRKKRA